MSVPIEQQKMPQHTEKGQAPGIGRVLKNRRFLLLWMAQLISLTTLNAANFGLVALVSARADGAILANLAIIVFTLPAVPFSAIAGVLVDRLNKRNVLWISNLLRMITMFAMFAWLLYDRAQIWPLFVLLFLTSLIGQFFLPAEGASIPLLVNEHELMPALSLFNISSTIAQALGFLVLGRVVVAIFSPFTITLGSHIINVFPTDMLFLVAVVFYLICVLLIIIIPKRAFHEVHRNKQKVGAETYVAVDHALQGLWRDLNDGWRVVRTDRVLFFAVIQLSVAGVVLQLISGLAGTFVKVILDRPTTDMSLILAPAAIGLVGASIFLPRISARIAKTQLTFIGLIGLAFGFLCIPTLHWIALQLDPIHGETSPFLLWTILLVVLELGTAMAIVNISAGTTLQERAPEESRARVISLQYTIYSAGTIPILLFAGTIAQFFGFSQVVIIIAIAILGFWLWGLLYLRKYGIKNERTTPITNP